MDCGNSWSVRTQAPLRTDVQTKLGLDEVENLLRDIPVSRPELIITEPPVKPKGGDVYIYKAETTNETEKMYFLYDQYRWISKGSNNHSNRKKKHTVINRYYYLKDPAGTGKDSLSGFRKFVYSLRDKTESVFLIHYVGDETLAKDVPHGNSKTTSSYFVPTKKSVLTDIQKAAEVKKPQDMYKTMHSDEIPSMSKPVACPRNTKQVENTCLRYRGEKKLSNDVIFCFMSPLPK